MYSTSPTPINVSPMVAGSQLSFSLQHQNKEVPLSQQEFLLRLGWQTAGAHPDTYEMLFRKPCPPSASDQERKDWPYDLGSGYWHWYEAVSYEFSKFITISDDA